VVVYSDCGIIHFIRSGLGEKGDGIMVIHIVRAIYIVVVVAFTASYAFQSQVYSKGLQYVTLYMLIPTMGAAALVMVDMFWRRKHLQVLSGLFFGLLAGLVIAFVLAQIAEFTGRVFISPSEYAEHQTEAQPEPKVIVVLAPRDTNAAGATTQPSVGPAALAPPGEPLPITAVTDQSEGELTPGEPRENPAIALAKVLLGVSAVFLSVSFVLQTKDDFRFVIPYVEFAKQTKGPRPALLDTSVIIDGRIADIADTRIIESQLVVPRFILAELQTVADSADKLKRNRGRRGLDILNRLRENKRIDLQVLDVHVPAVDEIQEVDAKLVALAKHLDGRIITNDYNLNKIAQLRGVHVININDLANALKPIFLPGEDMKVKIIKSGEEPGQGVGYLDDGTMVVVEQGADYIAREVTIMVTSALQTSAGRMIFGRMAGKTFDPHRRGGPEEREADQDRPKAR